MLAKIAPSSNDFAALARYLVHGKPGTTPHPNRVAWIMAHNLPTDDPELAAAYMTATAALSTRTKKAAYHLMIAWHERERPTPELMQLIAQQTLTLAGLAEHQALIMGHGDKPHPHLHILLNRVHPETGRAWKTNHDFAQFDRIMRQLANDHGCEYTPALTFNPDLTDDLPKGPNSRASYAAKRGAPTRRTQWSKQTSRIISSSLSDDLTHASTVDDITTVMADHGLRLEAKGKGFVVGNDHSYAKLSSLNLQLTAHGAPLLTALAKQPRPPRHRSIWTVDGVDIVRAFVTLGLADQDDVKAAIQTATDARQQRRARAETTTTLLPLATKANSPTRIRRPTRHPHLAR